MYLGTKYLSLLLGFMSFAACGWGRGHETEKFQCSGNQSSLIVTVDFAVNTVTMFPMPYHQDFPAKITASRIQWWCQEDGRCQWDMDRETGGTAFRRSGDFDLIDQMSCKKITN